MVASASEGIVGGRKKKEPAVVSKGKDREEQELDAVDTTNKKWGRRVRAQTVSAADRPGGSTPAPPGMSGKGWKAVVKSKAPTMAGSPGCEVERF